MPSKTANRVDPHDEPPLAAGYRDRIGGGVRAVEHPAPIAVEAEMAPLLTVAGVHSADRGDELVPGAGRVWG